MTTPLPKVIPFNFSAKNNFSPKETRAPLGAAARRCPSTLALFLSFPLEPGRFNLGSSRDPRVGVEEMGARAAALRTCPLGSQGRLGYDSPGDPAEQRGPGRD